MAVKTERDLHQTGFVGKGSEHLQLIKFWPSRTPTPGGAKIIGSTLLQPARSVCVSSEHFFHLHYITLLQNNPQSQSGLTSWYYWLTQVPLETGC